MHASLEKKVEERTAELARTAALLERAHREMHDGFVATVEVFASLIQAGTRDTVSVRKIAELAHATAKALGLSDDQQRDVHLAGLLCDLGKLTLHEALIHTPVAAMTAEQAAEFKRHTAECRAHLAAAEAARPRRGDPALAQRAPRRPRLSRWTRGRRDSNRVQGRYTSSRTTTRCCAS